MHTELVHVPLHWAHKGYKHYYHHQRSCSPILWSWQTQWYNDWWLLCICSKVHYNKIFTEDHLRNNIASCLFFFFVKFKMCTKKNAILIACYVDSGVEFMLLLQKEDKTTLKNKHGEFWLEVKNAVLFSVTQYEGFKDQHYICFHTSSICMYHQGKMPPVCV